MTLKDDHLTIMVGAQVMMPFVVVMRVVMAIMMTMMVAMMMMEMT